ncbi:hypothetical protein EAE90_04260 [Photorhabdus caribbeanensis]|nr:hypothetical protein [Photorhabdus caribbeanensis]
MVGNVTFEDFLLLTARFITVGGRSGYQNRKLYIESNLPRLIAQEINGETLQVIAVCISFYGAEFLVV